MKTQGKCISVFEDGGLILSEDNRRYRYKNSNITNFSSLKKGQKVMFSPRIDEAIEIVGAILKKSDKNKDDSTPSTTQSKSPRPKGSNLAFIGVLFQFLLLIPFVGYIFYMIGIVVTLLGVKKIAHQKKMFLAYDFLVKGLYSGFIVIAVILSLFFYFGTELFHLDLKGLHLGVIYYFIALFSLLFFNAVYSSYMTYKGMNILGTAYGCELLRVAAFLHPMFLILLPFGLGVIVYYAYSFVMLGAFVKMRLWEHKD